MHEAPLLARPATGDAGDRQTGSRWNRLRGPTFFALASLAVIWGVLSWLPERWGIRFGVPYLAFFSFSALGSAAFFVLLNWGPTAQPSSPAAVFASILFVYAATVGGLVAFGAWYYPQFQTPRPLSAAPATAETAAERRGREVFLSPAFNCFACHTIEALGVRGGQRGPDLSRAGEQAAVRKAGMSAEAYLREAILDPWACFTPLPASGLVECQPHADPAKTYPQLMLPGAKERMSEPQINDLLAFLKSLKGTKDDGRR